MAKGNRRDLYLQVSGDVSGLRTAMTAGKTIINDFSGAAINVIEEVEKEMAKLGTAGLPALKQAERAYQDTFRRIADSAREVANAPTGAAAAQILDANATREAAAAATAKATSLRLLAEAAQRADASTEGGTAATRAYAVAAATAAVNAEKEATALREQAQVLGLVERQLGTAGAAQRRTVAVSGEARAGYQQLSFQLGDVATQYASGTAASIIFAQQSGQVIQAISMISGESKGLIGFLGGPWGIAFGAALVALTPWVGKLLEGNDALGDAIDKLKKDAQEAEISRQAHDAFTRTLEGQIDAQRKLNAEMERGIQSQRQINQQNLQTSLDRQATATIALSQAEGALSRAREASARAQERARNPALGMSAENVAANVLAAKAAEDRVRAAQSEVDKLNAAIETAKQGVRDARIVIALDRAEAAADPIAAINQKYKDMADDAVAAARGNDALTNSLDRTVASIKRQQAAAIAAEQDRQARARSKPSLGSQIATERSGALLTSAQRYTGLNETSGNDALQSLFKEAGLRVDPKMTAWCAAFVNAVLATNGLPGTASLGARSFLNYGTATDKPVTGDIVVAKRGTGSQGHVGFYQGTDARGNILVFGGNTSDEVGTQAISRKDILAFRRAPSASQQERSSQRDANAETRNQDEYASLLSRVQNSRLDIEQRRLVTISDIAANERQQVDLAQADIQRAADKGVALGKWSQELADAVKLQAQQNADAEKAAITEKEQVALRQQAMDAELAQLDGQAELLQLQGQLAGTTKERRRIALELLEIESRQARLAIERQLAAEKDPARRAMLADDLSRQDRTTAIKRQLVEQQNASPLEQYRQARADFDIGDEMERAEVRFFENLNDELVEGTANFLKLKGVAGQFFNQLIEDVIRLGIEQATGGAGGLLGGLFKLVGIGGSTSAAGGGDIVLGGGYDRALSRGFSSGGWTGDIDRNAVAGVVHGKEFVFDADATARIGRGNLEALRRGRLPSALPQVPSVGFAERSVRSGQAAVLVQIGAGELFEARVTEISGNVSAQVASASAPTVVSTAVGQSTSQIARRSRRTIR